MNWLLGAFSLVVILMAILSPFFYPFILYWAWRARLLKRFLFCSVLAVLCMVLVHFILEWRLKRSHIRDVTGIEFSLRHPVFQLNSEYAWNGDGSTLEAYPIPEKLMSRFNPPSSSFFKLPIDRDSSEGWKIVSWRRAPIRDEDRYALNSALSYLDSDGFSNLPAIGVRVTINKASMKNTSYYAYNCNGYWPASHTQTCSIVDFYILDPVDGRIYLLYMKI